MKAGPVSHTGRHRDHGAGDQAADHAGERAFHAGADHHHARLGQPFATAHQAVNAGDSDVVDGVHVIAHQFRGDLGFLRHRDIAGAGADHGDASLAMYGAVAPEADGSGKREVLGVGELGGDKGGALAVGARNQNILGIGQQALRDATPWSGVLPWAKMTSGMPWRRARWWSTLANPRSSNGMCRMRPMAASISTAPVRTCSNSARSWSWSMTPEYQKRRGWPSAAAGLEHRIHTRPNQSTKKNPRKYRL